MVKQSDEQARTRLWSMSEEAQVQSDSAIFDRGMMPYLEDPFRGSVERRLRAPGETALSMELKAAEGALSALSLSVDQIDLTLVTSFPGDRFAVGNAAYLAAKLNLRTPAWNFESACSSSVVGLHMASSLIRSGHYHRILVVASTSNSALCVDDDPLSWLVGDGAGAFVVEPAPEGQGVLGWKTINTTATNDKLILHAIPDGRGGSRLAGQASPDAGKTLRTTAEPYLRECVHGALSMAGLSVGQIDFWVFNTPNAWYADFCGEVLGVKSDRYHNVYHKYANMGAALMPGVFYHALYDGRIKPGDTVLIYSIGSTSTASAVVLRVGEIALGPVPEAAQKVDGPSLSSWL
jgi:3-oxoacyl-[acyl-carrier-protein] synthase-3